MAVHCYADCQVCWVSWRHCRVSCRGSVFCISEVKLLKTNGTTILSIMALRIATLSTTIRITDRDNDSEQWHSLEIIGTQDDVQNNDIWQNDIQNDILQSYYKGATTFNIMTLSIMAEHCNAESCMLIFIPNISGIVTFARSDICANDICAKWGGKALS